MITEGQRERRRKYLGSSDAACLVGASPWKSPADVFWDKIREPSENESTPENDAIKVGQFCEIAVLDWFANSMKKPLIKNQSRVHANKIMAANFDALVADDETEAVEAKTAGIIHPFDREQWGEIETDEVPQHIIIQVQHQMAVLPKLKRVWIPVLLGGIGFRKYVVERNDNIIKDLTDIEVAFWNNHVATKTPPPDSLPSMETLRKIVRKPEKTVTLPDELVVDWLGKKECLLEYEKMEKAAKTKLLAALGDAEAGESTLGTVTYYEQERKEFTSPASSFRVCRFKKNKN